MGLDVLINKRLDGFNLDVKWSASSGITVLFGYSGAGKSLTLRLISGLLKPDSGYICLGGKYMYDAKSGLFLPPQERSVGYVFQDLALFPHMTVLQNILYGGKGLPRGEARVQAERIMNTFHIGSLADKLPGAISGGQKQRVAFARALLRGPGLLLLDEPFSALDHPLRLEMREFLKALRIEFNIPIVMVTHDLTEAIDIADSIVVYAQGQVEQIGSAGEILRKPATEAVSRLVSQGLYKFSDSLTAPSVTQMCSTR
jgi:molybdate transport system ATP-binding protein